MGLISIICPSCGGSIHVDQDRERWFCQFCGAEVIQEKQKIELSGKVSIDGIAKFSSLLERAFMFAEEEKFERAEEYFEKVLDIEPTNWKAYIGELLCETKTRKIDLLAANRTPLSSYTSFIRALKFSEGSDKEYLISLSEKNLDCIRKQQLKDQYLKELSLCERELQSKNDFVNKYKSNRKKSVAKITSWSIVAIISGVFGLILTIANVYAFTDYIPVGVFMLIFLTVPCDALIIVSIVQIVKNSRDITKYDNINKSIASSEQKLNQIKSRGIPTE